MRYTIIFLFLFSMAGFSQKTYTFDYSLKYELTVNDDPHAQEYLYYINSKENSYRLRLKEMDSLQYELYFDVNDGPHFQVSAKKKDFEEALFLNATCDYVNISHYSLKRSGENYDYYKLKDSIAEGKKLAHYVYKATNPRKEKRKNWGRSHYLIDTSFVGMKPILIHDSGHEETNHFLPNGILKERFSINFNGEMTGYWKLVEVTKADFKINISEVCD